MATTKTTTTTKTATTKKNTTDTGITTDTLARELANLTEEVNSLRTEVATLRATKSQAPASTPVSTTGGADASAHEKIQNILLLLKGTCGVRDHQLTHFGLK